MAAYDYIQDVIAAGLEYLMPVEVRDLTKAQLKNMSENHKDKPTSDAAYAQLDIVLGLCEPGFFIIIKHSLCHWKNKVSLAQDV